MRIRVIVMCFVVLVGIVGLGSNSPANAVEGSADDRIPVMVELEDQPTAVIYSKALGGAPHGASAKSLIAATEAAKTQLALVEAAQQGLVSRLEAELDATVLSSTQRVYNGVAVLVDRDDLAKIAAMPGVNAVYPLPPPILHNAVSVPFIGGVEAWTHDPPATGAGVTIGIIDTGIDYIHCDLGGTGEGADYSANDPTTVDDGFFPNHKVVGGWDFGGNACQDGVPVEDADPFFDPGETGGHGTHVAGSAAGSGVGHDGQSFAGPYDGSAPFDDMAIGPGVAPEASLYALKTAGPCSSVGTIVEAIEWAADPDGDGDFLDHLDVVNMSVGCSIYGSTFDSSCEHAVDNATLAGVAFAAAAGNNSDGYYNTGSPESAIRALGVGASRVRTHFATSATINTPANIAGAIYAAYQIFGTVMPVTADVVVADPRDACGPLVNGSEVAGTIVLVDWWDCGLDVKAGYAEVAGAVGVIVAPESWPDFPLQMPGGEPVTIPVAMVREADGRAIRDLLPGVNATIGFSSIEFEVADTLADFSSRGPRAPDSLLKPDIVAPGSGIRSSDAGTGSGGSSGGGTSMASPHAAGALAVVREIHPEWTVEELKALLMNTAAPLWSGLDQSGLPVSLNRAGAGRIDLAQAVRSQVVAFAAEPAGLVSVSFGLVNVSRVNRTERRSRTVKVVNKGNQTMRYSVELIKGAADVPGVELSLIDDGPITVEARSTKNIEIELSATTAAMRHVCDPTAAGAMPVESFFPGVPLPSGPLPMVRPCLAEEAATLVLTPHSPHEDHPVLHLPVHAVVRPVSAMAADVDCVFLGGSTARFEVPLVGGSLNSGLSPPGIRSLVSAFELVETSPNDAMTQNEQDFWDLGFVGVASDFRARLAVGQGLTETVISFAVVTHAPWAHPSQVEVNLLIDGDRDGEFEATVENLPLLRWGSVPGYEVADHPHWSDLTWTLLSRGDLMSWQLPVNGLGAEVADTRLLNSDAMVLSVHAADLGLTEGATTFDYKVELVDRWNDLVMDSTAIHIFDPAHPGLALTGEHLAPMYWDDLDGASIPVEYDREAYLANGTEGLLLIHHHNASGSRAEVVEIVPGMEDGGGAPEPAEVE